MVSCGAGWEQSDTFVWTGASLSDNNPKYVKEKEKLNRLVPCTSSGYVFL